MKTVKSVSVSTERKNTEKLVKIYRNLVDGKPVLKLYIKNTDGTTTEKIVESVQDLFPVTP